MVHRRYKTRSSRKIYRVNKSNRDLKPWGNRNDRTRNTGKMYRSFLNTKEGLRKASSLLARLNMTSNNSKLVRKAGGIYVVSNNFDDTKLR